MTVLKKNTLKLNISHRVRFYLLIYSSMQEDLDHRNITHEICDDSAAQTSDELERLQDITNLNANYVKDGQKISEYAFIKNMKKFKRCVHSDSEVRLFLVNTPIAPTYE